MEDTLAGNDNYKRLWRLAQPYLDTRENQVHTRISVALALSLIEQEGGEPQVVIPAVILHDVGWERVPEDLQLKAFGPECKRAGTESNPRGGGGKNRQGPAEGSVLRSLTCLRNPCHHRRT